MSGTKFSTKNMSTKARDLAISAHGDQKYGMHPYYIHLDAVAKIVAEYGETAEIIAYLHDVVEDTNIQLSEIEAKFGRLISEAVDILTDEPGKTRKERKAKSYAKMARVSGHAEIALVVKAADRLANMRACLDYNNMELLAMYKSEYPAFKEAVFRPNLCNEIWVELESILTEAKHER